MSSLKLYDTLSRTVSEFIPLQPGKASIYLCGATVQAPPHIGHIRSGVNFDILRRWLVKSGYETTFIRNVTDIDDKILHKAIHESMPWWALALKYERAFTDAYAALNVLPPTYEPRATGHITQMIDLIALLIERGYAYAPGNGDVYLEVRKLSSYLTLSNQKIDDLLPAQDADETYKRDVRDFALWKAAKEGDPFWPTPWGNGRPGWHIECSAMSLHYLNNFVDLHLGGIDLRFPHHENERAQSNCAIDKEAVSLWVHGEHLLFEGRKMAKSAGNVVLVSDLIDRNLDPLCLRLCFLENRYRSQMDLSWDSLKAAHQTIQRWRDKILIWQSSKETNLTEVKKIVNEVITDLTDDLDTPRALQKLRKIEKSQELSDGTKFEVFKEVDVLFGLDLLKSFSSKAEIPSHLNELLSKRAKARSLGDFVESDRLRDLLAENNILVKDGKDGQSWDWLI